MAVLAARGIRALAERLAAGYGVVWPATGSNSLSRA